MALDPGVKLGPYEILSPLGAGGMGEVYCARDTKLGREVAIKVLPEAFAENEERLARFEREARLLASLNHPNIATLYGLEESEGVHFLAMELADGETLAERLRRGPLSIEDALPIFEQIAEALEAAHDKGIIHRDLKPANITVSPEGKVKVLDFGLAKATGDEHESSEVTESPTVTRNATANGVILGTAAYMSPEQTRGKTVDKRTDVWGFGCVLYETLTGRAAFLADTVSDTLAAILKQDPDFKMLPASTPASVCYVLRQCLEKDADHRLHDIADARIMIESAPNFDAPSPVARPRRRVIVSHAITALVTLLVGVGIWLLTFDRVDTIETPNRFALTVPQGLHVLLAARFFNCYLARWSAARVRSFKGSDHGASPANDGRVGRQTYSGHGRGH